MYPEDDVKSEFWRFVLNRARDDWGVDGSTRTASPLLDQIEMRRAETLEIVDPAHRYRRGPKDGVIDPDVQASVLFDRAAPRPYASLQEALVAFLIHLLSTTDVDISYESWLRAAVLITASALRGDAENGRSFLRLHPVRDYEAWARESETVIEVVMTVGDDWSSCLSRDTFDYVVRNRNRSAPSL